MPGTSCGRTTRRARPMPWSISSRAGSAAERAAPAERIQRVLEVEEVERVRSMCERTLRQNWVEGVRAGDGTRFAYTRPSPGHYPWQWFWDSCFAAIVWRRFDESRARTELETLLAAQREDGFIGHTIFWGGPPTGFRRFTYNVLSLSDTMTSSIQPPTLAWAWRIAVGDPAEVPGI